MKERGVGSPSTGDEKLLKQAIVPSFGGTEKNYNEDDDEEQQK